MKSAQQIWNEANRDKYHASQKRYRTKHRKLVNERTLAWSKTPKGAVSCLNTAYKRRYGLTLEQYEAMLKEQNNVCAVCGVDKHYGNRKRLYVDHCHKTKKIRGLLCYRCNTGLASFSDNASLLFTAYKYITKAEGK